MRPRRSASLAVAAVAVGCGALTLAGCGSSRSSSGSGTVPARVPQSGRLRLTPARPTTRSAVDFRFTAPTASGVHGDAVIAYSVSVVGPIGTGGCRGTDEAAAPVAAARAEVGIRIGPAQLGRPWCAGSYTARAIELQRAHCRGSTPCPQYIRVVAIVGTASFTIARG